MDAENKNIKSMPVVAASFVGPALEPNQDGVWEEAMLPLNVDDLVLKVMGQPLRRAGRFIKMVCCGALSCLKSLPPEYIKDRKIGIFLATGLGNIDEILPFITQVFKHEGGFPSPNQFANSVSNAAAFFLAKICELRGVALTISQEELSFESALWLAQSYLESGQIDLALVGGCDVFTPSVDDYRARMNLLAGNFRDLPVGEGSSWLLLGNAPGKRLGDIMSVEFSNNPIISDFYDDQQQITRKLLPGFRLPASAVSLWEQQGWQIEDYLPYCGIHPTAAAFGIARALLSADPALYAHCNCHASGKQAVVVAVKS